MGTDGPAGSSDGTLMKRGCAALLFLLLSACSAGTPVQIINRSQTPLHDVRVSGAGFSVPVAPVLAPGEIRTVRVDPRGESGIAVSFRARERGFALPEQGYFEGTGPYSVSVVVQPDHSVSVSTKIGF